MTSLKKLAATPWLQVAGLTIAVSVLGMLSAGGQRKQRKYYANELKEPAWAPPGWVFAPAWTTNNVFLIKALIRLLHNDASIPHRKKLLILQGAIWLNFFSFGYAFFKKRSPWLGAAITQSDAIAALASFLVAFKADRKFSLNYLPLTLWTWFASSIAWYTALKNPDRLLKTPALLK
jgi:tryptophan-rich sensory protein